MKRYLCLFALILIVGLATNAQAVLFTFSGSDEGGTGSATMDIIISGDTLKVLIDNTSPITLNDGTGVNAPGITGFGLNLTPDFSDENWSLDSFLAEGGEILLGIWSMASYEKVEGVTLDFLPHIDNVKGALYNPDAKSGLAAGDNYFTTATLMMTFTGNIPSLDVGGYSPYVRMKNVGSGGDGSLKLAPVPEPATMLLFGCGLIGLAAVGRKKFQQRNIK